MARNVSSAPRRPWICCRTPGGIIAAAAVWMTVIMMGLPAAAAPSAAAAGGIDTGVKSLSQASYAGRGGTLARGLTAPAARGPAVQFEHGAVWLDPGYTPMLAGGEGHVLLQLTGPLSEAQQRELRGLGVTLIEYLPHDTWKVRLAAAAVPAVRALAFVRALGHLYPVDKVPAAVLANDFNPRSLNSDGSLTLEVYFQPDTAYARAAALLAELGATPMQPDFLSGRRLTVTLPQARALALLALDEVAWVEDREAPKAGSNLGSAALSHVDALWQPPQSLSGGGVVLGMWDEGLADRNHGDLRQVALGEGGQTVAHATHVAGTLVGSGTGNGAARGMAAAATLHSYDFHGDPLAEQAAAQAGHGMVLSNHSWGYLTGWQSNYYGDGHWTWFGGGANRVDPELGSYGAASRDWDRLIHDSGLVIVKSAGNDRSDIGALSGQAHRHYGDSRLHYDTHDSDGDYGSLAAIATAKNVITVGAVDRAAAMTSFSAWGPTRDGRLKPDLVAKGQDNFSTYGGSGYASLSGTSMAAPVVSGALALLIERYRTVTGGAAPSPQLLRALLATTAVDLGNPGPDYAYGWGLLDARAALEMIDADQGSGRRFVADTVSDQVVQRYAMSLPAGGPLKVTLAWTDPPGAAGAASALVNDLDLRLVAPNGAVYYPYSLGGVRDPAAVASTHGPNTVDNIEQVMIAAPLAGEWQIEVRGGRVQGRQDYALVSSRDMPVDGVPPGGGYVVINGGAQYALSYDAELYLAGYDNLGVTGYYYSEHPTPPAPEHFIRVGIAPRIALTLPYRFSAGEGAKTVYFWLRDAAGNISETAHATVVVDTLPPAAPRLDVKKGELPGRPQWRWSSIDGAGTFRYKLNDPRLEVGAIETRELGYTAGAPLSPGKHVLYLQERDAAGHWSAVSRVEVTVTAEEFGTITSSGGWPALAPSVRAVTPTNSPLPRWTWNSLQGGGGIFRVRLGDPDLSQQPETSAVAFVPLAPLADGVHTLYVQDRGSDGRWSGVAAFSVTIDTAAPVTSASVSAAAGAARSVVLQCSDAGVGCAATYYTVDGSAPSPQSLRYQGPITVGAATTLRFLSLDQAGNQEGVRLESFQVAGGVEAGTTAGGGGGLWLELLAGAVLVLRLRRRGTGLSRRGWR